MPVQFQHLYTATAGDGGVGDLCGDTLASSATLRKKFVNDEYLDLCGLIKGYWRVRSFTYTSTSTPAMATGNTSLSVPTATAFDSIYRLYFRRNGVVHRVRQRSRSDFLERSDTSSNGDPQDCCVVQTASGLTIAVTPPLSSDFVTNVNALVLEYFIELTRLSGDTDEPVCPEHLRPKIADRAAWRYAQVQGDTTLATQLAPLAAEAREAFLRYDVEHVATPRQLRPIGGYDAQESSWATDYGEYVEP